MGGQPCLCRDPGFLNALITGSREDVAICQSPRDSALGFLSQEFQVVAKNLTQLNASWSPSSSPSDDLQYRINNNGDPLPSSWLLGPPSPERAENSTDPGFWHCYPELGSNCGLVGEILQTGSPGKLRLPDFNHRWGRVGNPARLTNTAKRV